MSTDSEAKITIVHTETGMCLTTKEFDGWSEVKDSFDDYKTSLGPFSHAELDAYLTEEYPGTPSYEIWDFRLLRMPDILGRIRMPQNSMA